MDSITDNTKIVNSWRKPKSVKPVNLAAKLALDINEVREEIALRIERHLTNGKGMLVINAPAGVGKSYQAQDVAENIADSVPQLGNVAYFFPRHNGHNALERDITWLHIKGRYDDILSSEGDVIEEGNCVNAGLCKAIGEKGYSPAGLFCSPEDETKESKVWQCQVPRSECEYWQQWTEARHRFMPLNYVKTPKLWSEFNRLVILDEIDAFSLVPQPVEITADMLSQWQDKYPEYSEWTQPLITWLAGNEDNAVADSALQDILSDILPECKWLSFMADFDDSIELMGEDDIKTLPHRIVSQFVKEIHDTVEAWRVGRAIVTRIVAHKDSFTFYPKADFRQQAGDNLLDFPSTLLNARCDIEALRQVLDSPSTLLLDEYDYPIEVYQPHVALHPETTITYDISDNASKTTLRKREKKLSRWIQRVKMQALRFDTTLIVATSEGEKILKNHFRKEIEAGKIYLAHYGNVSGLNEFEDCQQVILSQPWNPSPIAVAGRYRSIYGGIEGQPLNLETGFRSEIISNGSKAASVSIYTMKDDRLRPIFEAWRDSEQYQAVHRVRPILSGKHIHIMFAIPIEDLPANDIIYKPAKNGRKSKLDLLQEAALTIIQDEGQCTQEQLRTAGFSQGAISRNWLELQKEFPLKPVMVSSERYPNGRTVGALTLTYPKV